jgi:CheY-like chemotaxis protein
LLVDDSALVRNSMQAALEPFGLELEHAENGAVAIAKAMAAPYDLIFLDVVMPQTDGPTALREIRARGNQTPVVLVTSVSTAAVVAGAVKLGNVFYIAKPFTPSHIRAIATKLLKLDPAVLGAPPRVLVQHSDAALAERVRKQLPAHVAIDATQLLAQSLDLADGGRRDLVLFETADPLDEVVAVGNVLRRAFPAAGIFALTDQAGPEPWQPDEGLDGMLPPALGDQLGPAFLAPLCLRPLVVLDRSTLRIAGFRGRPGYLPAYLAMLARQVTARCAGLDETTDLEIDLRGLPPEPDAAVAVITRVDEAVRAAGPSPSFRIAPDLRAATVGRLGRVAIL